MRELTIPFNKWSRIRLDNGKKTATRRSHKLGEIGDIFVCPCSHKLFKITKIYAEKLGDMKEKDFKKEGAENKEEFVRIWKQIYRRYDPERAVYVHEFKEVKKK